MRSTSNGFGPAALLAVIFFVNACGGGGSTPVAKRTGVFVDSAVANIGYRTASGSGRTNAQGEYAFAPGEEVTFFIGNVELPPVPAAPIVTPMYVFGAVDFDEARVLNLARLLQTLDTDGDPGNGITLSDDAHANATGTIDFGSATFDADPAVSALIAGEALVDAEAAAAHLKAQYALVGTWYGENLGQSQSMMVLTFLADGTYIHASDGSSVLDPSGRDGIERGTYTYDPATGAFHATALVDTDGDWGFDGMDATLTVAGNTLTVAQADEGQIAFARVAADPMNPIVGSWYTVDAGPARSTGVLTFLAGGKYVLAQDGDSIADPNGEDGMEYGTWAWDSITGRLDITVLVNTDGDWGFGDPIDPEETTTVRVSGNNFTLYAGEEDSATLYRLDGAG